MDGLKVVYSHNGLAQSNGAEQTAGPHNNMKDAQIQRGAEAAMNAAAHRLHDPNYIKLEKKNKNTGTNHCS